MVLEILVPLLQQEEEEFGPDEGIHGNTTERNNTEKKNGNKKQRVHTRRLQFRSVLLSHFTRDHRDTERGDEE